MNRYCVLFFSKNRCCPLTHLTNPISDWKGKKTNKQFGRMKCEMNDGEVRAVSKWIGEAKRDG